MKKLALLLLAGILATTVLVGCNNGGDKKTESSAESSVAASTEESTEGGDEESAAEGEESAAEGEESAAEGEESATEGEESAAEGEESAAEGEESGAGAVDTSALIGGYVSSAFVNIETKQVVTPDEFAAANGLDAAPIIYFVLKEDGKCAFGPENEAKGAAYTFDENGNVTAVFEENGETLQFEYDPNTGCYAYEDKDNGIGYILSRAQ